MIAAGEEVALAETERSPGRSTGSSDGATAIGDRVETGPSGTGSDPPADDPIPTGTDLVVVDGAAADPADPSGGEATGPDQRSDDDGSTPTPTPLGLGSTAVTTAGQGPSAATRTAEPESQATTGVSELDVVTPQAAAIEEPGPSPRSSTTTSSPPASTETPSPAGSTATTSTSGSSASTSTASSSGGSSSEGSSFDDPPSSEADAGPVDGCHPAYVSCLPRLSGDALDCADLTADQRPVTLRSPAVDPYRLDGDGDGVGCRSG
jgi:hypothetical protein